MSNSLSVHKINDRGNLPFSSKDYSKFKYGSKKVARKYGEELAAAFIEIVDIENMLTRIARDGNDPKIVVVSSPYQFIPTATYAMKDYFVRALNHWLVENEFPVVQETKITRSISYREDYGALSAEERMKLIGKDSFHIDKEFVKGKYCLFLDDIRITGSHEIMIQKMVDEYQLDCDYSYLYYAILEDPSINPNIENELNYGFVNNLRNVNTIIRSPEGFLLNTRTVKYILDEKRSEEFDEFIGYQTNAFLHNLYHQAIGNSYHLDPAYSKNLSKIKNILTSTNSIK